MGNVREGVVQLLVNWYSSGVQTKTIQVDGQKAVTIPDRLLKQCPLGDEVDVSVVPGGLLVKPSGGKPRAGWAAAMKNIADEDLDQDFEDLRSVRETPAVFDRQEWDW